MPDLVIVLTDVVCLVGAFDTKVGVGMVTFVTGLFRLDTLSRLFRFGLPSSSKPSASLPCAVPMMVITLINKSVILFPPPPTPTPLGRPLLKKFFKALILRFSSLSV